MDVNRYAYEEFKIIRDYIENVIRQVTFSYRDIFLWTSVSSNRTGLNCSKQTSILFQYIRLIVNTRSEQSRDLHFLIFYEYI